MAAVPSQEMAVAELRMLDKMTARVEEMDIPVGQSMQFGKLNISVRTCRTTLPEEAPPEAAAYIEVGEIRPGALDAAIFNGWMFASSPALSAMEHPIYDIWVVGCKGSPDTKPKADNTSSQ